KKRKFVLVLRWGVVEHLTRLFVMGNFIRKHTVVDEPGTAYCLGKKHPLFSIGHSPEFVRFVHRSPWLSIVNGNGERIQNNLLSKTIVIYRLCFLILIIPQRR